MDLNLLLRPKKSTTLVVRAKTPEKTGLSKKMGGGDQNHWLLRFGESLRPRSAACVRSACPGSTRVGPAPRTRPPSAPKHEAASSELLRWTSWARPRGTAPEGRGRARRTGRGGRGWATPPFPGSPGNEKGMGHSWWNWEFWISLNWKNRDWTSWDFLISWDF